MDPLSIQQALVPLRPDQRFEKDLAILVQNPDPNEIADPIRRPVGVTVSKGGGDNYPDTAGRHGDGVDRKTRPATRHLNAGPVSPARQLAPSPSAPTPVLRRSPTAPHPARPPCRAAPGWPGDPRIRIRIGNPSHPERPGWPEEGG
jgi:hypothetical protein